MKFELTLKLRVNSLYDEDRVARQLSSLFEFGTIKESISEGLKLRDDPKLLSIDVHKTRGTSVAE